MLTVKSDLAIAVETVEIKTKSSNSSPSQSPKVRIRLLWIKKIKAAISPAILTRDHAVYGGMDGQLQADRASYGPRGLNSDNPEVLYKMTEATLDLLEVALNETTRSSVRAQEQRSPQRDSSAVAEYFQRLSDEALTQQ